jgi:carbon-monoxide dehydrogenase iron sulfur subunit
MAETLHALRIDPALCTGCKQCELACSWVQVGAFQPAKSLIRVHIFDEQASYAPYTCFQCDEAWCMQACPVNAIDVDEATGAKVVLDEVCVGCKLCVIACPFGTMFYDKQSDAAVKCDLCAGDPACAHACPTDAIASAEVDPGAWLVDFGQGIQDAYTRAVAGEGS